MDQRPSNPSDDAWQPHEPGRPAGDGPAQQGPTPDDGADGTPEQGWRGVSWQGAPDQAPPAQDAPGPAAPDQVGHRPAGYGRDVAAQGPAPTGPGRSRRLLAGAALATGLAVGGAGVAAAVTSGGDALPGGSERAGSQNGFFP